MEPATEEEAKKKTARDVFIRFSDLTSVQGIAFINRGKRWYVKAIWVVLFLGALAAWLYHSQLLIRQFYAYDVTTKVSITHDTLPFPSITLCNINPLRKNPTYESASAEFVEFLRSLEPSTGFPGELPEDGDGNLDGSEGADGTEDAVTVEGPVGPGGTEGGSEGGTEGGTEGATEGATDGGAEGAGVTVEGPVGPGGTEGGAEGPSGTGDGPAGPPGQRKKRQTNVPAGDTAGAQPGSAMPEPNPYQAPGGRNLGQGNASAEAEEREVFLEYIGNMTVALRMELGHQLNTMMTDCQYNGLDCSEANFTHTLNFLYGNCYTFNSIDNENNQQLFSTRSGATAGLTLTMYVEHGAYLNGYTDGRGLRVAVHPYGTLPFVVENGISLSTGHETYIGLKMVQATHLGSPYPNCTPSDAYADVYNHNYTIQTCLNTCLDRNIAAQCNCFRAAFMEYYPKETIRSLPPCVTEQEEACGKLRSLEYAAGTMQCDCLSACTSIFYNYLISNNNWPDQALWYDLVSDLCENDIDACNALKKQIDSGGNLELTRRFLMEDNFIKVHIYYQELNFETIEENPQYEASQYYSDIGGAVGLWIGATVFTLAEMLDLIVNLFYFYCYRRHRNPQDPQGTDTRDTDPQGQDPRARPPPQGYYGHQPHPYPAMYSPRRRDLTNYYDYYSDPNFGRSLGDGNSRGNRDSRGDSNSRSSENASRADVYQRPRGFDSPYYRPYDNTHMGNGFADTGRWANENK